ncbi:MAG: phosphonate ABC transporter, permease protein PhnE [Anaerolineales bacterium]|nr:phosphonate ABC transporter, permease protein PhnE [Anaerolineales bacterium]
MNIAMTPDNENKTSLVPPIIAAIASLIIPGLGQMLARSFRRGLILLISFITIFPLTIWRFTVAAPRDTGVIAIFKKGLHLDSSLVVLSIFIAILYIWIAVDAFLEADTKIRTGFLQTMGLFLSVMVVFFTLGWQIGEIDPVKLVMGADEGWVPIKKLIWPWQRAIEYDEEHNFVQIEMQIPCTDTFSVEPHQPKDKEPFLIASPTCGDLSDQGTGALGTEITLKGGNFEPGIEVAIQWEDPVGNTFAQRKDGEKLVAIPDENGNFETSFNLPYSMLPPSAQEEYYIWELGGEQLVEETNPHFSKEFKLILEKMVETIFIGMMATFFGIIFALPVSFLAARNLMESNSIGLAVYYLTRAILNIIRSIEPLIWGIIFVIIVGLGPFAGILALTLHSIAALGKLYSEAIESIDSGPIEAIQATGANWLQVIMFAVVPQVIPPFVSFTIYRWDINIRMSTIVGFVGGGGIGFLLSQYIRMLDYRAAGIAVWLIAVTVMILDYVSAEIRVRFI